MLICDLFTGIGGFALGAQRAFGEEIEITAFCESNAQCREVLCRHFPGVWIYEDIRREAIRTRADIITGGDPCPIRSSARSNGPSAHPDLSGYFLAVVGRLCPRWVVRENVPAPDDVSFIASLEALGYRTLIVSTDAATYTGQKRSRDIIIGHPEETTLRSVEKLLVAPQHSRKFPSRLGTLQVVPCLTTNRTRYDSRDCYIWDGRLRILDGEERQAVAGFPPGWLSGFSEACIARMCGNAIVPAVAEQIFRAIRAVTTEQGDTTCQR